MDKKYIYWGLGLVAVGGLAYYFFAGKSSGLKSLIGNKPASNPPSTASSTPSTDAENSAESTPITAAEDLDETLGSKRVSAGGSKREIRRNCRKEARARGLKGKAKRKWRRKCRREGGYDDNADFLGISGTSGFGCTTSDGYVGRFVNVPQGTSPETYVRTCVSRGFRDRSFLGASGTSGFGCTTNNGMVGRWVMLPQGTSPETYVRTCVSRGFRDRV